MAGTSRDMTAERPGGTSPVYGLYGDINPHAATLDELVSAGALIRQVPIAVLTALESGSTTLHNEVLEQVGQHEGRPLTTATCLDDYWTASLEALTGGTGYPLGASRRLAVDKAATYDRLLARKIAVPCYLYGPLSAGLLAEAVEKFGPAPVLKPVTGNSSLGVYRYRDDLTPADNLAYYRVLLRMGNIDTTTPIIAMQYVGGTEGLEISAELIVANGEIIHTVLHEKLTSTQMHPFVDRVMVSPPARPAITEALPGLYPVLASIAAAFEITHGVLHTELRLDDGTWQALDIAVRPGGGLIAHSVHALTGIDPRVAHILAGAGKPIAAETLANATPTHTATGIACCYIPPELRPTVSLAGTSTLVRQLRAAPDVLGWHFNVSEIDDAIYDPDAGLSLGVGAPDTHAALTGLRSLVEPHGFTAA